MDDLQSSEEVINNFFYINTQAAFVVEDVQNIVKEVGRLFEFIHNL